MKKLISITLSLLLIISAISGTFVMLASAESVSGPTNYAPTSWQAGAHWYGNGGRLASTNDSHLGGKAFTVTSGSANHQYVDAEQTLELLPNTAYRFSVSVKGLTADTKGLLEKLLVYTGGAREAAGNAESFPAAQWVASISNSTIDAENSNDTWIRLYFDFTTNSSTTYDLRLKWGNISSFTISDITLYAKAVPSYTVEGNGSVLASKSVTYMGENVALTAIPDSGETFVGWYKGDVLLSNNTAYNYIISADSTTVIAKFTSFNISLMDETKWGISGNDTNATITKTNNVISVNDVQWNFFYIPMSLEANTTYELVFDVKSQIQLEKFRICPKSCGVAYKDDGDHQHASGSAAILYKDSGNEPLNSFISADTWYENNVISFTTTNETDYNIIIKTAGQLSGATAITPVEFKNMYIKTPFVLYKTSAKVLGNGKVTASAEVAREGATIEYLATADEEEGFLGWYVNDTLVSTNTEYSHTFTADGTVPTAKFTTYNLMKAELWKTSPRDTNATVELSDGIVSIKEIQWDFFYIPVHLKANTDYTFNFNFRSQIKLEILRICPKSCGVGYKDNGDHQHGSGYAAILYRDFGNEPLNSLVNANTWYENNTISFTTTNETDYNIIIKTGDKLSGATATTPVELSNVVIKEALKTAYNNSAALRSAESSSTGKNGLRIYNSIEKSWVNTARIVEFGSIAISKETLNNAELTLETQGAKSGVAYQRGTIAMKLWDTTEKDNIFTTYLTNIPSNRYGEDYSIRTYAKDYKGTVYYGAIIDVCVFQIANTIGNSQTATDTDKAAFHYFVNENTKEAYYNWCIENNKPIGNLYTIQYLAQ